MMRPFWVTLAPMLAAAALTLWGGERMARRVDEDRVPVDRDRVFGFTESLRGELDRLDRLYTGHLTAISHASAYLDRDELASRCRNLVAVRKLLHFEAGKRKLEIEGERPPPGLSVRQPEVLGAGEGGVLIPRSAVILPKDLPESHGTSGWLAAPDGRHRVFWQHLGDRRMAAVLVDAEELHSRIAEHLDRWEEIPMLPLKDARERLTVVGPGSDGPPALASSERNGPAAMVMPHRTSLGEWQVLAWDQLERRETHDGPTLILACGFAGILLLAGVFLHIQQGRALKLAEERVSFVNRVSHELGTPLTNILLNLDLATRGLESRPGEAKRRLGLVGEEVQRLGRLVANVLTFSRGERKTLELHASPCVPDEAIGGVLERFQPSLDRRGIRVEWSRGADSTVLLDADALAQVVGNLISNVEKYAASGGWLGIATSVSDACLRVTVSDRGPGVPLRHRKSVFDAFERVHHGVNEGASGTGLGLSIARDLARRMGGDLVLASPAEGARFELTVPAPPHLRVIRDNESAA